MTDLIRATITVDATKPWNAYYVMKYIDTSRHFKLIRIIEIILASSVGEGNLLRAPLTKVVLSAIT